LSESHIGTEMPLFLIGTPPWCATITRRSR